MYIGIDIGDTKCAVVKGQRLANGEIEIIEKSVLIQWALNKPFKR
jgi:hypothetical protein